VPEFVPNFVIPRFVPLVLFVAAIFMGAFDLYRKQKAEIQRLAAENVTLRDEQKRAVLVVGIHEGSAFLRHVADRRIIGMYLHINTSVENKGGRASVVSKYHLRIEETGTDEDVRPRGFLSIQGPQFVWAIDTARKNLALTGFISIPPDNVAGPDILPFYVAGVPPEDCHLMHCTLEVTDSNDERATAAFELSEYRQ